MPNVEPRNREWCFTLNNYTDLALTQIRGFTLEIITYVCFQPEVGESGTPHLQGYLVTTTPRTLRGIRQALFNTECLRGVHLEITRGTKDEARDYCRKEDSRDSTQPFSFTEIGDFTQVPEKRGQGARNDIAAAARVISDGGSLFDVASNHSEAYVKFHKGFGALQSALHSRPRVRQPGELFAKPRVLWYYGCTGSGKSHAAYEEIGEQAYFVKMPGNAWFDGYIGQDIVLFDDYRANWFSYGMLLRLLDKYPLTVEVKGSTVNWRPTTIYITCPKRPEVLYCNLADKDDGAINQLLRRIDEVKLFGDEPTYAPAVPGFFP